MYILRDIKTGRYFVRLKPFGVSVPSRIGFLNYDVGTIPITDDRIEAAKQWKTRRGVENYQIRMGIFARDFQILKM